MRDMRSRITMENNSRNIWDALDKQCKIPGCSDRFKIRKDQEEIKLCEGHYCIWTSNYSNLSYSAFKCLYDNSEKPAQTPSNSSYEPWVDDRPGWVQAQIDNPMWKDPTKW